jgi:hypothetical protein
MENKTSDFLRTLLISRWTHKKWRSQPSNMGIKGTTIAVFVTWGCLDNLWWWLWLPGCLWKPSLTGAGTPSDVVNWSGGSLDKQLRCARSHRTSRQHHQNMELHNQIWTSGNAFLLTVGLPRPEFPLDLRHGRFTWDQMCGPVGPNFDLYPHCYFGDVLRLCLKQNPSREARQKGFKDPCGWKGLFTYGALGQIHRETYTPAHAQTQTQNHMHTRR